jgi:ribonuclease HI
MQDHGVGFGYSICRNGRQIAQGYGGLRSAEVFDVEVIGAAAGLEHALKATTHKVPIHVCLDNSAAIMGLQGRPSDSSQYFCLRFQKFARQHGAVNVRWCPGHLGIEGNEAADSLAKKGCSETPLDLPPTLSYIKRTARAKTQEEFSTWWHNNMPEIYEPLGLKAEAGCPKELALPRTTLHHLLAARTHHGDFAAYHQRFNHEDAQLECSCGRDKNPHHIFYCRKVNRGKRIPTQQHHDFRINALPPTLSELFQLFLPKWPLGKWIEYTNSWVSYF